MTIQFQPPTLIGAQSANTGMNPFLDRFSAARAAGSVMMYEYKSVKPKKQLKEIIKILMPEKKTFLKLPYKFKYNIKDRCVVCGSQKKWESGDSMRPPLPLHKVRKGYPMRGTYCEKHSQIHRQYEMLEQQILADEHGLSFSAYMPSTRRLNPLASGPVTSLKVEDIQSLSSLGWGIQPPVANTETKEEELFRLIIANNGISARIKTLLTEGAKVVNNEEGGIE